MSAIGPSGHTRVHRTSLLLGIQQTWCESISISAKDPKRMFCRRHLVGLDPPMRRMIPAYPPLLDALVLSSGQIIAVGGFGQLGRRGFPVRGGRGHSFRNRFRPPANGHDVDDVIAVCLELLEKDWQRHRGPAMD